MSDIYLTSLNIVLFEKLVLALIVKKFIVVYGTRKLTTVL
jgi:hypothetical protein